MAKNATVVSRFLIFAVFMAFISIGLPDAIFGVAWPDIKDDFGAKNTWLFTLNVPGALSYMASSALVGLLVRRLGIGHLLTLSTFLVAMGLFVYALAPSFWVLPFCVALIAFGSGAIDSALNLFAAERFSVKIMNWLHAFYGIGALAGPFIMAGVYALGQPWRWGYATLAMIITGMAVMFLLTGRRWDEDDHVDHEKEATAPVAFSSLLKIPDVWLSVLFFMSNAIIESVFGLWAASMFIERFGLTKAEAGFWTGLYWLAMTGGRILFPMWTESWPPARVLTWSTLTVVIAAILMIPHQLMLFQMGTVLIGLGIACSFPTAMAMTPGRLGARVAEHAVGFQVSASTFMFMILPTISGWFIDRAGYRSVPFMLLVGGLGLALTHVALEQRTADRSRG